MFISPLPMPVINCHVKVKIGRQKFAIVETRDNPIVIIVPSIDPKSFAISQTGAIPIANNWNKKPEDCVTIFIKAADTGRIISINKADRLIEVPFFVDAQSFQ